MSDDNTEYGDLNFGDAGSSTEDSDQLQTSDTLDDRGVVVFPTLDRARGEPHLDLAPGDLVQVEVLEGQRPTLDVRVVALIDDVLDLSALETGQLRIGTA